MTRLEIHLDTETLQPIFEAAVDRAIAKTRDDRPTDDVGKLMLGKRAAADACSISVSSLDRNTYPRGDLKAVKLEGRVLYPITEIERWIAAKLVSHGQSDTP